MALSIDETLWLESWIRRQIGDEQELESVKQAVYGRRARIADRKRRFNSGQMTRAEYDAAMAADPDPVKASRFEYVEVLPEAERT